MAISKKGFSILEAVASVFIITLVLTTAMSIILTMRNQAIRSEEKIKATDVGSLVRYDLEKDYDYLTINTWLDSANQIVTYENCALTPISCDIFNHQIGDKDYRSLITIRFLEPTLETINYEIIRFELTIIYFKDETVTLEGVIYETT